jgi:hypothetical protein
MFTWMFAWTVLDQVFHGCIVRVYELELEWNYNNIMRLAFNQPPSLQAQILNVNQAWNEFTHRST